MNEILRDRLQRKLEALPEDKAYLVLDYVEFLESSGGRWMRWGRPGRFSRSSRRRGRRR